MNNANSRIHGHKPTIKAMLVIIIAILSVCLPSSVAIADDADWPQFQKDAINYGVTGLPSPLAPPQKTWQAFTHYRGTHGIDVTPIAANGKIFVIDVEGYAWAFDADLGTPIWSTPLEGDIRYKLATPAYGEGKVYFATDAGYVYALDETTGEVLWGGRLTEGTGQNAELSTQITYEDGKLYLGSWEGKYYCLDADGDGTAPYIDWTYYVEGTRYDWYSGAGIIGDYVLFGNTDGLLNCLDKATGSLVDSCDVGAAFGVTAGHIRSAVSTNSAQNRVFLTSGNGYLYAIGFDAATGQLNAASGWYADIDDYSTSTPVCYGGGVYVCSGGSFQGQEGGVYCFNDNGTQQWFNDLDCDYGSQASPAIAVKYGLPFIFISTGAPQSAVVCIDDGGETIWEYVPSPTEYSLQGVSLYDGKVFFGNDAGYLFALGPYSACDVNQDGSINVLDMSLVGDHFGEMGTPSWIPEDVNSDGSINVLDMSVIGDHFGE